MISGPTRGRALVTRRAVSDIVRMATLGSYGVTGFAGGLSGRIVERIGLGQPGLHVVLGPPLEVDLDLTIAYGLPVAEVTRQVDSAVRYAVRRALGRGVDRLTINVRGLRFQPGGHLPEVSVSESGIIPPGELADSGMDVA
ncbi:MAG: Asp23/Gls24 family envelope stress response protein [Chloroflexota bacterium]